MKRKGGELMAENGLNEKQASKVKLYTVALIYTFSIGFSFLAMQKMCPLCGLFDDSGVPLRFRTAWRYRMVFGMPSSGETAETAEGQTKIKALPDGWILCWVYDPADHGNVLRHICRGRDRLRSSPDLR